MTRSGWAACAGAIAGLALACSAGRTNERGPGATAQADTTQKTGSGTGSAAANEQAASTRPTEGAGAGAQGTAQAAQPKQPEAKELPEVAGRVTAVSKDELRVQPRDGDEVRLQLAPDTTIDLDGRQASLSELTPGTEVRASYEEAKGKKSAMTVHAKTQ